MACFVNVVYLVEHDRQEKKTGDNALAPKWWLPFKYKLVKILTERDGSVFGVILEWDGFLLMRPSSAPMAVLALRGTLVSRPTFRRDYEEIVLLAVGGLEDGSVRFKLALKTLKSVSDKYGSGNVCIAGHSLGAGLALQVGKALAKDGVFVEAHLFNPPSVSLWQRLKKNWSLFSRSEIKASSKWAPRLYVNTSDSICCGYTYKDAKDLSSSAKLFRVSKGNQNFFEAHSLDQWWADDLEL